METPSTTPQTVLGQVGEHHAPQADPAGENTIAARRPQIGDMVRVEAAAARYGITGAIARVIGLGPNYEPIMVIADRQYTLTPEDVTIVTYDRDHGWTPVQTTLTVSTECDEPHLGLATTRQLLDEIAARIEVDGANGGGGLDYTTVKGRP